MNKIFKILISIILIFTLVFTAGFFCACLKEPAPNPVIPVDPTPTPTVVSKKYKLHNWYISFDDGLPELILTEKNYATVTFPVPERENFTFNGWYIGEDKVADETGKSLMTKEL